MAFLLTYVQVSGEPAGRSFDTLAKARTEACVALSGGAKDISILDEDSVEVAAHQAVVDFCASQGGAGGGGSAGAGTRSSRTLRYTIAVFNEPTGRFAVALMDESAINNVAAADRTCGFLQQQLGCPVLLVTNSGRSRGLNHALVRNFQVHPSQITGWQEVTFTVPY